jgi:hypothetical protein
MNIATNFDRGIYTHEKTEFNTFHRHFIFRQKRSHAFVYAATSTATLRQTQRLLLMKTSDQLFKTLPIYPKDLIPVVTEAHQIITVYKRLTSLRHILIIYLHLNRGPV